MRSLFLSPHCDDETLFGAFTILKHQPRVVICFGSVGDYGATKTRFRESQDACTELGADVEMLTLGLNLYDELRRLDREHAPEIVWAPSPVCSHPDHRDLHYAALNIFGERLRMYDTYRHDGDAPVKNRILPAVPVEDPLWVRFKLKALACYVSQLSHPRANIFFRWSLDEFAEQP